MPKAGLEPSRSLQLGAVGLIFAPFQQIPQTICSLRKHLASDRLLFAPRSHESCGEPVLSQGTRSAGAARPRLK